MQQFTQSILMLLPQIENKSTEIYHYSNEGICSWYDFALAIFDFQELKITVKPIRTKIYPTIAVRPMYSVLECNLIKHCFNIFISDWRTSLNSFIADVD